MTAAELVEVWRRIIVGEHKSWVLFANGTCVVLTEPAGNLAAQASELLRAHGPVLAGGSSADFGTIVVDPGPGWVVYCHHPDVLTYVAPSELPTTPSDLTVGLHGRTKRDQDSQALTVIHIEDNRLPDS